MLFTVIFAHASCTPTHSNECGPLLGKVQDLWFNVSLEFTVMIII